MKIIRTNSENADFKKLADKLNIDQLSRSEKQHTLYDEKDLNIRNNYSLVLYVEDEPLGFGYLKANDDKSVEIRYVYVHPNGRGKGYAIKILRELEVWAKEQGFTSAMLETHADQDDANIFYKRQGYLQPVMEGEDNSYDKTICMVKEL